MSDTRTHCGPPPIMRPPTATQARILAYIRHEVEHGRGIPSKRKLAMKFGKNRPVMKLLLAGLERRGLIGPATEEQL